MKLFIDDANVDFIRHALEYYPIDGVTTNPAILSKAEGGPVEVLKTIRSLLNEEQLLFVQVIDTTYEGMLQDAHAITNSLGRDTIVKIPVTREGIRAIKTLSAEGIRTCGTVVMTPMQAYLAAKAGASFVAPYVNRIDNMGYHGFDAVSDIQAILDASDYNCDVLVASFRNTQQVQDLAALGVGAATISEAVFEKIIPDSMIDESVKTFGEAFFGKTNKTSMADLLNNKRTD